MLLLPIRTETTIRRTPLANYTLLAVNVLTYLVLDFGGNPTLAEWKRRYFILDADWPRWYQFITYQFAHADFWHLAGNMLFLWIFGNSVNAKMRDIPYVLFYLAGGVFAALVFSALSHHALLGASGAIAAVTTAYLAMFPRSRVTVLYALFFIGFFDVPAMLLIGIKVILWDNVVSPQLAHGAGGVAYSAHLGGYLFGFLVGMILLAIRAVPRDQFDMLALIKRWNQRRAFASAMSTPEAQARAQYGTVARAARPPSKVQLVRTARMNEITELRGRIAESLKRRETGPAAALYEQLLSIDDQQCLPATQQLEIGREYYANGRFTQAAAVFERYLANYRSGPESDEVRLLLGIIYARELQQYSAAEKYLKQALERAATAVRREQAQRWLDEVRGALGGGAAT